MSANFIDPMHKSVLKFDDNTIINKVIKFNPKVFEKLYKHYTTAGEKVLILSHNDSDGHGSSAVIGLWEKCIIKSNITVYNMDGYTFDYSTIKDKLKESDIIYITDLSLPEESIDYIIENTDAVVVWIDHHLSSQIVPEKDPTKLCKIIHAEIGVSAACLCYVYMYMINEIRRFFKINSNIEPTAPNIISEMIEEYPEEISMPTIIKYISLYDTFHDDMDLRFTYGFSSRNVNINSDEGYKFWKDTIISNEQSIIECMIKDGDIIKTYVDADWARMRKDMIIELPVTIVTHDKGKVLEENKDLVALNNNGFSMSFGPLIDDRDGCIRYYQKKDGTWSYGCYSSKDRKTALNCELFARHFNGGGHKNAAGWSSKFNDINAMLSTINKSGRLRIHIEK